MVKGILGHSGLWAAYLPDLRCVVILNSLIKPRSELEGNWGKM